MEDFLFLTRDLGNSLVDRPPPKIQPYSVLRTR